MSNCNKLFLEFNKQITPSSSEMDKMKKSRESLETKITAKIKEKLGLTVSFYTQGSGAKLMKTIIIKHDGTYDADRGVFLPEKPSVTGETVQKYIYDAVKDHTEDGASHRKKCIRVFYRNAYNIDFPVYYEVPDESYSYLAVKGDDWVKDDPTEMIAWFCNYKDDDGQLLRIVKYLKAWASKCSGKMPSGIALSVWAAKNFSPEKDRDDKCLLAMLKSLKSELNFKVSCISPVEPFDDLTSKLTDDQRSNFQDELTAFCDDAQKAIDEPNQLKSSKIWRKYLGIRFNLGVDEDVDTKAAALFSTATTITTNKAMLDRDGKINTSEGVSHQIHRNYGG